LVTAPSRGSARLTTRVDQGGKRADVDDLRACELSEAQCHLLSVDVGEVALPRPGLGLCDGQAGRGRG
jgi:hypothetical protein